MVHQMVALKLLTTPFTMIKVMEISYNLKQES